DPNFRRGLKRLPAHDLTFEAWIYHPQIKTLTEVARECPDVKIVLNHFGGPLGVGPYRRDEVFPQWRAEIKALAACPDVYGKVDGLAMIVNGFDFHLAPLPRHRAKWPKPGSPMSTPASRISGPTAACSRATSRSTRGRAAIRCCSMRSSGSP